MSTALILAAACLVVAFLGSAWVHGISRLSLARAVRLGKEDPKRGTLLGRIAENPRPFLASALLVMLVAKVTAIVIVTVSLGTLGSPWGQIVAVASLTFILFQLVELAPRSWVLERPDQAVLLAARPVYILGKLLAPVASMMVRLNRVFLLILPGRGIPRGPLTSEEEVRGIIDVAESEEVIETEEREMLHSVFEFGDTVVREVMVPRPDVVTVQATASAEEALDLLMKQGLSRVPVIETEIDNVVGIVYLKDLVRRLSGARKPRRASDVMREPKFVPESKGVADLLPEMREARTHMMIVVDEYGGVAGLVTLEDLLEEIVGEISDEYDREESSVESVDESTLRVDARVGIDEVNDMLGTELPHKEWDSVGGLVGGLLGRIGREGDTVRIDGVELEVERTKGRRISKVLIHRGGPENAQAAGS